LLKEVIRASKQYLVIKDRGSRAHPGLSWAAPISAEGLNT